MKQPIFSTLTLNKINCVLNKSVIHKNSSLLDLSEAAGLDRRSGRQPQPQQACYTGFYSGESGLTWYLPHPKGKQSPPKWEDLWVYHENSSPCDLYEAAAIDQRIGCQPKQACYLGYSGGSRLTWCLQHPKGKQSLLKGDDLQVFHKNTSLHDLSEAGSLDQRSGRQPQPQQACYTGFYSGESGLTWSPNIREVRCSA